MRTLKSLILAIAIVAGTTTAYAGCLSDYNHTLIECNSHLDSSFMLAGCRADAWVDYYACILNNATV